MPEMQEQGNYDIGLIGLGVMGSNFVLNIADHGFAVAGYNRNSDKIKNLAELQRQHHQIATTRDLRQLCAMVRRPRAILLLVPAGKPVDAVIEGLVPHLEVGDIVIDSGNSHFTDTDRRGAALREKGLRYMGMGMSGGEKGARHGPSLMVGGDREGYEHVKNILEAAAARTEDGPCVAYMGPGSAGHYVKMVHNGIEYALMQLIAESYDLLKSGLGLNPEELHRVYRNWNEGPLNSYLIEITSEIFLQQDERGGGPLIELILDRARQKGTGLWTVKDALNIQVPVPTINTAVMMRHMSNFKEEREAAARQLQGPERTITQERQLFINRLENGLYCAAIGAYAQGMSLLRQASRTYDYHLDLHTVARVWTSGCIIRAALLQHIQAAYGKEPELANLLLAPPIAEAIENRQADWRSVSQAAIESGIPVPGLTSALAYWDGYRSDWLPANLIMAQRDYFGAHTYERMDAEGTFHSQWGSA